MLILKNDIKSNLILQRKSHDGATSSFFLKEWPTNDELSFSFDRYRHSIEGDNTLFKYSV